MDKVETTQTSDGCPKLEIAPEGPDFLSDGDKVLSNEKLTKNAQSPNGGECNENIQQNEESDKMERTTELYRRLSIDDDVVPCLTVEIVQEETKDICEDPNVIEWGLNWVRKRVYGKRNEKPRMKHHLDSMTTVMTPCHNDFLVMYSTSQGEDAL